MADTAGIKTALEMTKLEAEIEAIDVQMDFRKRQRRLLDLEIAAAKHESDIRLSGADVARIYPFIGKVDVSSVRQTMLAMSEWDRRFPGEPMAIVLNSPGGSVIDGLALYDFLDELKQTHHLTTVVRGYAASMGGVLMQAGHERVIGKNAYMLIHEVSKGSVGSTAEQEDELKLQKRLQARLLNILAERSTMSKKQIDVKWKYKDWWLDSAEVVKFGFADRVG